MIWNNDRAGSGPLLVRSQPADFRKFQNPPSLPNVDDPLRDRSRIRRDVGGGRTRAKKAHLL